MIELNLIQTSKTGCDETITRNEQRTTKVQVLSISDMQPQYEFK